MSQASVSITDPSDIVRKIGLLLATAESHADQGNQDAADSYIAKAHQLQQKYSIDQAMLADSGQRAAPVVIVKTFDLLGTWGRRKVTLAHRVGNTMDCMGYFETRYTNKGANLYTWTAFGFAEDVEWLESLVTSLCHQADVFLAAAQKERPARENHRTFGARFMDGFTDDIVGRLRQARQAARKEAEQEQQHHTDANQSDDAPSTSPTVHSVSLVLASKKKKVEEEYKARVSGGRTSYTRTGTSSSGYAAGREAGSKANLSRGSVNRDSRGQLGK